MQQYPLYKLSAMNAAGSRKLKTHGRFQGAAITWSFQFIRRNGGAFAVLRFSGTQVNAS